MMLHGNQPQSSLPRPLAGPLGRQVSRMQIVDDRLRLNLEGAHQVVQ